MLMFGFIFYSFLWVVYNEVLHGHKVDFHNTPSCVLFPICILYRYDFKSFWYDFIKKIFCFWIPCIIYHLKGVGNPNCSFMLNVLVGLAFIIYISGIYRFLEFFLFTDEFGFSGQSPLELKVLSGERSLESFILEMSFKSYTTDGLLIVHRSTSSSDFYTVSVHNMTLAFWWVGFIDLSVKLIW